MVAGVVLFVLRAMALDMAMVVLWLLGMVRVVTVHSGTNERAVGNLEIMLGIGLGGPWVCSGEPAGGSGNLVLWPKWSCVWFGRS